MKKIITLILSFSILNTFAQTSPTDPIVNFPDIYFKYALVNEGYDLNGDLEIQVSEAEKIITLNSSLPITDLTGIEALINLERLELTGSQTTNTILDLSSHTQLKKLSCLQNTFTNIIFPQSIQNLVLMDNKLGNLDLSQLNNMTKLEINGESMTDIVLPNNIDTLAIRNTDITTLDLSNKNTIKHIDLSQNKFTDIVFPQSVEHIFCYDNQLTSLDFSNYTELITLNCSINQLTSLILPPSLEYLYTSKTSLTSLDLSKNLNLKRLSALNSQLTTVTACTQSLEAKFLDNNVTLIEKCEVVTATTKSKSNNSQIIKAYNLQGKEVDINTKNELIILMYSDGKTEKVIQY